jgi:formate dehydrogenase assembly factor FdhD
VTSDTITTPIQTVEWGLSTSHFDFLAIEEPLQFCLNGSPLSITMRTPGSDLDLATIGTGSSLKQKSYAKAIFVRGPA